MEKEKQSDDSSTYVQLYSQKQYEKDELNFEKSMQTGKIDWQNFKRLMVHDLCRTTSIIDNGYIGEVSVEDVITALKYPRQYWRTILAVSDELMRLSPHYYRLNSLYSNMALFCWWIDLYDVKDGYNKVSLKKTYGNLCTKLEDMNLKHEFSKIMKVLPYQDIYCGLIFENQNDFFIQQISYKMCKLYEVQDGIYNFVIDLSKIKATNLEAFPDYVKQAYSNYLENINDITDSSRWYEPPADKQICIKLNSQWTYPFPLLIGLIKDILDLDIYKKLQLQSARTDNYKAILINVPIDKEKVDKPLLTPPMLGAFAEMNKENMNDDIGILHTLGDGVEIVNFKNSTNTRNNVSDASDNIFDGSGVTKELFNGSSSGTAVTFSVENDSGFIYSVYRQLERWTNRFIKARKYNKKNFKFYFYLLDITIFNRDNVSKRYKDAVTLGATVIDKWLASLDMTPSRLLGSYVLHNEIFDFQNNFVPLASSYNASTKEVGRPTNKSQGKTLDKSGEITQDADSNIDR